MYKAVLGLMNRSALQREVAGLRFRSYTEGMERKVMDLRFRSPIGLAAGFDTRGRYYNAVSAYGCSFDFVGPLQLSEKEGLKGAVNNVTATPPGDIILGMNITKQDGSTTEEQIKQDYLTAFAYSFDFCDLSILNFSDTAIGAVHEYTFIQEVTDAVLDARISYDDFHPILLRLSPGLKPGELDPILDYSLMNGVDGVMVCGMDLVKQVVAFSKGRLPVIAVARISKGEEAAALLDAGASLIALDTTPGEFSAGLMKKIFKSLKTK